jgi:hypothetical protein
VEAGWATDDDPGDLLDMLPVASRDVRRARLLAVACCRRLPSVDLRSSAAVDVAERVADGEAMDGERAAAEAAAAEACLAIWPHLHAPDSGRVYRSRSVAEACRRALALDDWFFTVFDYLDYGLRYLLGRLVAGSADPTTERRGQAGLIRDIFGDPPGHFPERLALDPGSARRALEFADVVYAERSFHRLPELADLLEWAGCRDQSVLRHCRRPGVHVRGCWAVDLVRGR